MNIQTLSDTELNRAMIWLYCHQIPEYYGLSNIEDTGKIIEVDYGDYISINTLDDWNLIMPLAVAEGVSVINLGGTTQWFAFTDISFETVCMSPIGNDSGVSCMDCSNSQYSTKPLRAIVEVLVMIGMEGK